MLDVAMPLPPLLPPTYPRRLFVVAARRGEQGNDRRSGEGQQGDAVHEGEQDVPPVRLFQQCHTGTVLVTLARGNQEIGVIYKNKHRFFFFFFCRVGDIGIHPRVSYECMFSLMRTE